MSNKYDKVMLDCAELWAKQSYCTKAKVGAVLADDGRIVATGYNGTISGLCNKCEEKETIICPHCKSKREQYGDVFDCLICNNTGIITDILKTSSFVLHAEQNILCFCAKEGIPTKDLTMYITLSPCELCAKLIAQAGIKRVVYKEEYKLTDGIDFLRKCGVSIYKYEGEC